MLPYILGGIAALLLILVVVVAMQPAAFRIERSMAMAAPPAVVFEQVNDFHKWSGWSPWEKIDPNMQRTHDGPSAGVGASYAWNGNGKAGQGKMTILESAPPGRIRIKLEFLRPMKATNLTDFTFAPDGSGTAVNWAMTGTNGFMGKAFCLVMNMDKLVGSDFEKGLTAMKGIVEKG